MQGDIQQWVQALNHFDTFFDERIKARQDISLQFTDAEDEAAFPSPVCQAILQATSVILENCSNKQLYASVEVRYQPRLIISCHPPFICQYLPCLSASAPSNSSMLCCST